MPQADYLDPLPLTDFVNFKKETLTIVFGCECFHQYLYGKEMEVESDHNKLEAAFDKSITKAPPRIQRLLLQWQYYRLKVKYVPGKQMFIADALSRPHLKTTYTIYGSVPDSKTEMQVYFLLANFSNLREKIKEFQEAAIADPTLQTVADQTWMVWLQEYRAMQKHTEVLKKKSM